MAEFFPAFYWPPGSYRPQAHAVACSDAFGQPWIARGRSSDVGVD